jgi:pimeloyl-ACP methyl ester carboxylesterase
VADDGTVIGWQDTGEGAALLLVHGTAADSRQWTKLMPFLADGFSVAAMDRRGRGSSGPIGPSHSLAVEYGDIVAVARSIGEPVHLFGHSSGARFALHAASQISDLASLILYEPPEPKIFPEHLLEALSRLEASADREGLLRLFLVDFVGNSEADFAFIQHRPIWPIMLDNALTLPPELRAGMPYRFAPADVADTTVPTLLILGEHSVPELGTTVQHIADALARSSVVTLPGQGHGAMFTAPELLSSEIRRFVVELDGFRLPPDG